MRSPLASDGSKGGSKERIVEHRQRVDRHSSRIGRCLLQSLARLSRRLGSPRFQRSNGTRVARLWCAAAGGAQTTIGP